jgi:DNA-binding NtrC family response regulator
VRPNVLIVAPDVEARDALTLALVQAELEATGAGSAADAMALLDAPGQRRPSLLVLDAAGGDADELAALAGRLKRTPVVVLTPAGGLPGEFGDRLPESAVVLEAPSSPDGLGRVVLDAARDLLAAGRPG